MFEEQGKNPEKEEGVELSTEQAKQLAEKIKSRLVVDRAVIYDELIELSADHIAIEETGKIHIKNPENLKGADLIALTLIGKNLAKLGGLCESDTTELSEIIEATGLTPEVATARLSDLRREGISETLARGQYRIRSLARARRLLLSLAEKKRQGGS